MDFLTQIKEKAAINQATLTVPMALGPNDKFTPFKTLLNEENPDAVIWQADAIADDFSKEVIWDQVKAGGGQAVDDGDLSAMKKAAMKAELEQVHQEFLANWPSIQAQVVQELATNAKETVGDRFLFLAYATTNEGGQGEMAPADQAFFLTSALKVSGQLFDAVFIPSHLDENLQGKVRDAAAAAHVACIETVQVSDLTTASLTEAFEQTLTFGATFVNLELSADMLAQVDLADLEALLTTLSDKYKDQVELVLTLTGQLSKDQLEAWLIFPSAFVTLALSDRYQTPMIHSTVKEVGWH
ncbi:hypothetical protein [Fructobacillus parabroussonetiae]|uniref:3-dehydroquinate dehydratase n=1 Tax=Fructobacillus parabroussonetiae TaxID=2713174 RepID=A0ABS5QW84_9LACO|nr:hypothetical protein [Fructobacillus parabroussonetiae]MBS9337463.1 hypothetical protein [Fructobacillus parabroussonetiae]